MKKDYRTYIQIPFNEQLYNNFIRYLFNKFPCKHVDNFDTTEMQNILLKLKKTLAGFNTYGCLPRKPVQIHDFK